MAETRTGMPPSDIPTGAAISFVALTYLIAWGLAAIYLLAPEWAAGTFGELSGTHPFFFLMTWSPAISGFLIVFAYAGLAGVRGLLSRVRLWRCPLGWAAFVLVFLPLVMMVGSLLKGGPLLAPVPPEGISSLVVVLFIMLFLGPVEEFGWRGVLQPLLQRVMAPVWAGALVGVVWGTWHLPAFFLAGTVYASWDFLPFIIGSVVLAILVTPILNLTRGGLFWPMLFHWQLINPFWPDAQPWDSYLLFAVAAVVIWWNRKLMLRRVGAVTEVIPGSH